MRIMNNISAMNAHRLYTANNSKLSKSLEKLSSGYAINRAGDNAAGLAVSEKMRAQIAGLEQASKNAQDGISMVQTYEGALTETDSILQRMRSLAVQSANGTYDNSVDRVAIEQEFKQLNDELDQIADTDFNGVIVLNGGKMADGLEAVDGVFDYSNKAGQVAAKGEEALAAAQKEAQAAIDDAQKVYDKAKEKYDAIEARDLSFDGKSTQWNTVDNNKFDETVANELFDTLTNDDGDKFSELTTEFEAQFKWDADNSKWTIDKVWYVDEDGNEVEAKDDTVDAEGAFKELAKTTNGGFQINAAAGGSEIANVVLDSSKLNDGDTVTLKFTLGSDQTYAPSNIGMDANSYENSMANNLTVPTIALGTDVTTANMSQEMADALTKLDAADITFTYDGENIEASISDDSLKIVENEDTAGQFDISYTDADGNDVVIATVTPAAGNAASEVKAPADMDGLTANGNTTAGELTYEFDGTEWKMVDGATGEVTATKLADGADTQKLGGQTLTGVAATVNALDAIKGDRITISYAGTSDKNVSFEYEGVKATEGTISFGVALDAFKYDPASTGPSISASKNEDINSEKNIKIEEEYFAAEKALNDAKAAMPGSVEDLANADEYKVSKSNSLEQATGKLTYNDGMSLQVGARTKDIVDFTFEYDAEAIGDLEADLNCTSEGLGTKELSLATQESANAAIDRIDHAINKISMVRGTFGAIQNRLEHKINNLDTNNENLTAAESRIRDTDMAAEMMEFTKNQILSQASQSMLAQANQLPQGVLSLLQ